MSQIHTTENKFGLLGDLLNIQKRVGQNLNLAASNVYNLLTAARDGDINKIPQDKLVETLAATLAAIQAVSN